MTTHTIILIQFTADDNSRTYLDFETLDKSLSSLCDIYEAKLKLSNPSLSTIQYDLVDLLSYLDSLSDLSCLSYSEKTKTYLPHGWDWIKSVLYNQLKEESLANAV